MEMEDIILQKIMYSELDSPESLINSNKESEVNENALEDLGCKIYQLCGFLAFKGKTFTKCDSCVTSLIDKSPSYPNMRLTEIKNLGGLKFPSTALFELVNSVLEPKLAEKLKSSTITSEFVSQFLQSLPSMNYAGIGCSQEHGQQLLVEIIMYYTTIRLYFFSKIVNKEKLRSGSKTQSNMKMAKL